MLMIAYMCIEKLPTYHIELFNTIQMMMLSLTMSHTSAIIQAN